MDTEISALADAVLELIPDHRHWIKCAPQGGWNNERHCVISAAVQVAGNSKLVMAFQVAFIKKADELFPQRQYSNELGQFLTGSWLGIPQFNDADCTRYAHVRQVLEKLRAG
jgi:hypothetical protein